MMVVHHAVMSCWNIMVEPLMSNSYDFRFLNYRFNFGFDIQLRIIRHCHFTIFTISDKKDTKGFGTLSLVLQDFLCRLYIQFGVL